MRLRNAWQAMRTQVAALSDGLRATSHSLHPSVLTDLGFLPALRTLAQHFIETGVDVSVRAKESAADEIPANVATALYRIAEEAIRNAVKHAESAAIRIVLSSRDGHLHMSIEDAGSGFDLVQARVRGGLGILSMQERARMVGGSLFVRTADGQGTQVLVRVPLV